MAEDYRFERSVSRGDAAAILRAMGDGVASGSVRLGESGETERVVDVPEWVDAELEYETAAEAELEVELTWHSAAGDDADSATTGDADSAAAGGGDSRADDQSAETDTVDRSPGTDAADRTDEPDAPSLRAASDDPAGADADASGDESAAVGEHPAALVGPAAGSDDGADTGDDAGAVTGDDTGAVTGDDAGDERPASQARFELFEDRAGEWRWRLVHRNGNIIADSGEGYSRKHDARRGLRSVMRNAPGAEVVEESSN